ncbi:GntR family transcriptional regulator [Thermomonospora echinospora]|uniref:GntR family transcriptional regulator n=1 Tax=Thermomonospora echinospora TaxID=1992 RepID=UPI0011B0BDB0|nr:GntR family transcriptional regulator [Thermomonospora echinospora]
MISQRAIGIRPQLSDEVAARLREQIMDGRVRPGEYLRLERLAAEFGISVTPVREALQSLRSQGFVQLEPRRGFVVAPLSRQDVKDLFWVQADIAAELTARSAATMTTGTLRELSAIQHAMGQAVRSGRIDLVEEHNHGFHRCINLAACSAKLAWSLGSVARYVPRGLYGRLPDWPRTALDDHERVLAALRKADPDEARTAMRTHIVRAGELLIAHLERQGLWNDTPDGYHQAP